MSEPSSPLSRRVDVLALPAAGLRERIVATEAEREALALAYGLQSVDEFAAEVELVRWRGEGVEVRGHLAARIVQTCVVSLEPVPQALAEDFSVRLVPEGSRLDPAAEGRDGAIDIAPTGDDPPDVFAGRSIDVGAIVAEHFALAIDPYPRAPGAELPGEPAAGDAGASPFAVLSGLASGGGSRR